MKLRAAALLLLILAGDSTGRADFESLYQEGRSAFVRGDFAAVTTIARGGKSNLQFDAEGRELFALLEAEVMAKSDAKGALALMDRTPQSGTQRAAVRRLMTRGYALGALGSDSKAEEALAKAARIAAQRVPDLLPEIAILRVTPAAHQNQFESCETFAREALAGARERRQHAVWAYALIDLGLAEMNLGRWNEALDHFYRAERLARSLGMTNTLGTLVGNIGWVYARLGDFDEAEALYQHAQAVAEQTGDLRTQPTWLTNMAYLAIARRQYATALSYAERAVDAARRLKNERKVAGALVNLAEVHIGLQHLDVAAGINAKARQISKALSDTGLQIQAELNDARIDAANGNTDRALTTLTYILRDTDQAPIRWEAQALAASVQRRLGNLAQAEALYEAALETGDAARAAIGAQAYLFAFETNLIHFYDEMIDLLLSRGRKLEALQVAERSRAATLLEGKDVQSRGAGRTLDAQALARKHGATILSYWLTPEHSLLWVVTANDVAVTQLPAAAALNAQIDAYRDEILSGRASLNSSRAARLYDTLVAPAVAHTRTSRFIVVPDGRLNAVTLETFVVRTPTPHYWIEDATITYTPSLTLLAADKASPHGRRIPNVLVMGNIPDSGADFPALARAGEEIKHVASHFPSRVVLDGPRATAAAYTGSNPQQFEYLHFVAHGTAATHAPLDSAVVLADRKLTGNEIFNHRLDADLVTISSCNSAGSRSYAGEGLVGLAWAFLRAGAHRVIAAQWDVNDLTTPKLMDTMYRELASGRDPASALREAKLKLLHSSKSGSAPFNWAPFILYGAP